MNVISEKWLKFQITEIYLVTQTLLIAHDTTREKLMGKLLRKLTGGTTLGLGHCFRQKFSSGRSWNHKCINKLGGIGFLGNINNKHIAPRLDKQSLANVLLENTHAYLWLIHRSRYLRHGLVIASHSILWDVITYPCLRYLLLVPKSSYEFSKLHIIWCSCIYHIG